MTSRRIIDPAGAVFGLAIPLLCALAVLILTAAWEPRLPAEVASHWSGSTPDSFTAPMTGAWTMALLIALVGGGCCAIAVLAQAQLMMRRYMLVIGLAVTFLMATLYVATLAAQLDVSDPSDTPFPAWSLGLGICIGVVVGWLGASLLRDYRERPIATTKPDPSLPRGPVELPIVDQVGTGRLTTVVLALLVLVPVIIVCLVIGSWWPMAIAIPAGFLVLSLLRFTVRVDERGVSVRNLGSSALDYDLDEIIGAKVIETRPFQDWGGWGMRIKRPHRYGLVTNTGPALVITTESGHELTITTDRAEEMAGAINTLADRRNTV
ncbi:DUF1648 domain-containing protein [Rhodococcus sp. HNM0563]|uniref:DUF1648 domain-containing protein n=1 Tax=unclassified Rhodococcus (in: high G+C Gram-positive bacteria) TaxID=192944 RepID=UPI00146A6D68|nr:MULTISPECIES: DUF1648 domain-containing protein [unclassified Rhodococcus (in: high G+C Gram-positive bacteria)]MCK0091497.1 DUF1648 domain-containing protein [Rhodococcus sp. F64268]NLU63632.1 DUF1648 domain-containing protein [Rhodococcus sp. HNM0563]